ncbi:MAG: glucose-1-phosphate cytidylyltransferase [Rhodomicrobiaceae bacterium]
MKAVILAGGLGTRISEETDRIPKPMIEIGHKPILWHIMKIYSYHGIQDFIICCGYKGYLIKEYFANYFLHMSDITFDIENNKIEVHQKNAEPWRVTLVDTGEKTYTGGRLQRIKSHLDSEENFCFTYGDGVGNINITKSIELHNRNNAMATVTAVYPPSRFGAMEIKNEMVHSFKEKPKSESNRINGGFFVLSPKVIDYIADDSTIWEHEPMETLVKEKKMAVYEHDGFWQPMDTLHDKRQLEELWRTGQAPWKIW